MFNCLPLLNTHTRVHILSSLIEVVKKLDMYKHAVLNDK